MTEIDDHETLIRLYIIGIYEFASKHSGKGFAILTDLLESPLASKSWPLTYYSRENLMSAEARRQWIEPDLKPLSSNCFA